MSRFWILFLFLASPLLGTELAPWFGKDLQLELRGTALYQYYKFIATSQPNERKAFDQFYTGSASMALIFINAETEVTLADTRHRSFGFDNLRFTGRYLIMDDIIGDPVSMTTGVTLTVANRNAVEDMGSFHHGTVELEWHLAVGREVPCYCFWLLRWWTVLGYGIANEGNPWLRGDLYWERNVWDKHQYRFFVLTLWGLGHKDIDLSEHFRGYGPIRHRSVDVGFRYSYLLPCADSTLSIEYRYRAYAKNFPKYANLFMIRLFYPLGF